MVNCSPVVLLTNTFVVLNMGQVLQRLVPQGKLPGVLLARDVRVACTSKSLRFFGRREAIIGGKVKIVFRRSELRRVIWCRLVVSSQKNHVRVIRHHQWNTLFFYIPQLPRNKQSSLGMLIARHGDPCQAINIPREDWLLRGNCRIWKNNTFHWWWRITRAWFFGSHH